MNSLDLRRYILAPALVAGAICAFPSFAAAAGPQRPSASAPPGWTAREGASGLEYFLPPGATTSDVYEAVFPMQFMDGTLEQAAAAIWHAAIGSERVVDSKGRRIRVSDGAPTYEVLVASIDSQNQGVYRIFVFKQYGQAVAAGELRFNDVDRIEAIGKPAVSSLENMRGLAVSNR